MARSTALARRPTIIVMPRRRFGRIRRAGRRAVGFARRVRHSRHAPSVSSVALVLGAVALGYAQQKGHLAKLPKVAGSVGASLVVAGYIATKYGNHRFLKTVGTAAMAVGGFGFGRVQAGGTDGLDEVDQFDEV